MVKYNNYQSRDLIAKSFLDEQVKQIEILLERGTYNGLESIPLNVATLVDYAQRHKSFVRKMDGLEIEFPRGLVVLSFIPKREVSPTKEPNLDDFNLEGVYMPMDSKAHDIRIRAGVNYADKLGEKRRRNLRVSRGRRVRSEE